MNHHSLFSDKSDLYKAARPSYPKEIFDYLASQCTATNAAWDCACGNGQAAVDLAKHFTTVFATDISQQQIDQAILSDNVRYRVAPSEMSGLDDNSMDLVCVAQALHWFDLQQFWPEVARVLKHGGVFCTLGYSIMQVNSEIDACIEEHIMQLIEPYWAPHNQLIWNNYRDIEFPFDQLNTPNFDMCTQWNLAQLIDFIHTFSATRRCMDDIGEDFFKKACTELATLWGSPSTLREINFELFVYVGLNN